MARQPGSASRWAVVLLSALAGCAHAPSFRPPLATERTPAAARAGAIPPAFVIPAAARELYVVRRSWHIDIGFAAQALGAPLARLTQDSPDARYVLFGFGDRRFLHADHPWLPDMLAALWPGDGLILVTLLADTPQQAFTPAQVITVRLDEAQMLAAQRAVLDSLRERDGNPVSDGAGPYPDSAFWRASETYSAAHTCNTWAAQVLQAAQLPVRARGVLWAGQLWRQVQHLPAASTASR
jgi:hypothetical protein